MMLDHRFSRLKNPIPKNAAHRQYNLSGQLRYFMCVIAAHAAMVFSVLFFRVFCRGKIKGLKNIEQCLSGGFVLAANHSSYLDWLVLGTEFRYRYGVRLTFLAKDWLFEHPFFGLLMEYANCVRVNDEGTKVLEELDLVRTKYLAIFPEGRRSRTGRLEKGHSGAVVLALAMNKPLIPVGLIGFSDAWPPNRALPWPHRCEISFAEPLPLDSAIGDELNAMGISSATQNLMATIGSLIGQPYEP